MVPPLVPKRVYYIIFATLFCLTLITVDVAFYNFGLLNLTIALMVATGKATLVVLYFMHVRYSDRLTWVFAGVGAFWLAILLALTLGDVLTRGWLPAPLPWSPGPPP